MNDYYFVKSNEVVSFNYDNWYDSCLRPAFPDNIYDDLDNGMPYFDAVIPESLLNRICMIQNVKKLNKIKDFNVFEFNVDTCNRLIQKCQNYIKIAISDEFYNDIESSEIVKDLGYAEYDICEDLCSVLNDLRFVKKLLMKYTDYSFLMSFY